MPPFEPDGEQQVERHELCRAFGNGQVAAHKGRDQAQNKEQDRRHHQVPNKAIEHLHH